MAHRTQLYLDEAQYRWLRREAGRVGSIAQVVRDLIDAARTSESGPGDPLIDLLLEQPPAQAEKHTSVTTLDEDVYGG